VGKFLDFLNFWLRGLGLIGRGFIGNLGIEDIVLGD
jgi:hypothetical protein